MPPKYDFSVFDLHKETIQRNRKQSRFFHTFLVPLLEGSNCVEEVPLSFATVDELRVTFTKHVLEECRSSLKGRDTCVLRPVEVQKPPGPFYLNTVETTKDVSVNMVLRTQGTVAFVASQSLVYSLVPLRNETTQVTILGDITTFVREFHALEALHRSPISRLLLGGRLESRTGGGAPAAERTTAGLNEDQEKVVVSSRLNALTMVQGPPGTGKTRTLVESLRATLRDPRAVREGVLVCTPSNVAIEEIVQRVLQEPFFAEFDVFHLEKRFAREEEEFVRLRCAKADLVLCTLSMSGSLSRVGRAFRTVFLDESTQATEPSSVIPLQFGCSRLVMFGDPCQLPPTVLSPAASAKGLSRSLFERLMQNGNVPLFLSKQYRMHPEILRFPSQHFYGGKLQDCSNAPPSALDPYRVFLVDGSECPDSFSFKNVKEAAFVQQLVAGLPQAVDSLAVITPYSSQKILLKNLLPSVTVDTVDSFQGKEVDVAVLSCVRTRSLGFLDDWRRLNVALTRAKVATYVVMHPLALCSRDDNWKALVEDAQQRSLLVVAEKARPENYSGNVSPSKKEVFP